MLIDVRDHYLPLKMLVEYAEIVRALQKRDQDAAEKKHAKNLRAAQHERLKRFMPAFQ